MCREPALSTIRVRLGCNRHRQHAPVLPSPMSLLKVRLPKGRLIAICPFVSHHDTALYPPDAWRFDPDRAPLTIGDGAAVVPSVAGLSFGGGSYRCPGRFFAEMEVALIVQMVMWEFEMGLQPKPPPGATQSAAASYPSQKADRHSNGQNLEPSWLHQLAPFLRNLVGDGPVSWGLGLFPEAGAEEAGADSAAAGPGGSAAAAAGPAVAGGDETWQRSGDVSGLLPSCNLLRLVGLKVPSEPCFVSVTRRKA